MTYTIEAVIHAIGSKQQVSDKFAKREVVLHEPHPSKPEYDNHITFQFVQDKCDLLNEYKVGDMVRIKFALEGRKYTDKQGVVKYFNTNKAFDIEPALAARNEATVTDGALPGEDDSTLPF